MKCSGQAQLSIHHVASTCCLRLFSPVASPSDSKQNMMAPVLWWNGRGGSYRIKETIMVFSPLFKEWHMGLITHRLKHCSLSVHNYNKTAKVSAYFQDVGNACKWQQLQGVSMPRDNNVFHHCLAWKNMEMFFLLAHVCFIKNRISCIGSAVSARPSHNVCKQGFERIIVLPWHVKGNGKGSGMKGNCERILNVHQFV